MDVAADQFAFAPLLIILLLAVVALVTVVFLLRYPAERAVTRTCSRCEVPGLIVSHLDQRQAQRRRGRLAAHTSEGQRVPPLPQHQPIRAGQRPASRRPCTIWHHQRPRQPSESEQRVQRFTPSARPAQPPRGVPFGTLREVGRQLDGASRSRTHHHSGDSDPTGPSDADRRTAGPAAADHARRRRAVLGQRCALSSPRCRLLFACCTTCWRSASRRPVRRRADGATVP